MISADLGKISKKKIPILGYIVKEKTLDGGTPSPSIVFHKKRCANEFIFESPTLGLFKTSKNIKIYPITVEKEQN